MKRPETKKAAPPDHQVVSRKEWLDARRALLKKEKESTRLRDEIAAARLDLPWVKIDQDYTFASTTGKVKLADLFAGHSQLALYHFMFAPDWQEGCPSCSLVSDHFDGTLPHLAARDVAFVAVSRAPIEKIEPFKKRMGWDFNWVSSCGSDFNHDFRVTFTEAEMASGKVDYNYTLQEFPSAEAPGFSVFYKDAQGDIYHTYSTFGRGVEQLMTTYRILDMMPKGRDEDSFDFPMEWVRHHDRYGTNQFADADKPYWPDTPQLDAAAAADNRTASGGCGCGPAKERA